MRRRRGEVVDFVGIGLQIVEFLASLCVPKDVLGRRQFAFVVELFPHPRRRCLEHVIDVLSVNFVRHVIAEVNVATVGDAAHEVVALVHASAETVDERLRRFEEFAEERVALHPVRRLDAGEAQHGGREIHEAHEAVGFTAGFVFGRMEVLELVRDVNDERDLQSGIVGPAFAARHAGTVVGVVEDNRIICQAIVGELLEVQAGVGIGFGDNVVVLRPVLARLRRVGVVGGDAHLSGIVELAVWTHAQFALVTFLRVEHSEERLSGLAVAPMSLARGVVPDQAGLDEVVILFGIVGTVVAGFAKELREHFLAGGERHHTAHMLGAGGRGVHSGDNRRARRRAHGRAGPRVRVNHPPSGELIHVRRGGERVAVAAHMRAVVFAGNPENVRADGFSGSGLQGEAVEKREPATQDGNEISSRCRAKKKRASIRASIRSSALDVRCWMFPRFHGSLLSLCARVLEL